MVTRARRRVCLLVALALVVTLVPVSSAVAKMSASRVTPSYVYSPDAYEQDDTYQQAKVLPEASFHNFDSETDQDWALISAEETGQPFLLETVAVSGLFFDSEIHVWSMDESGTPVADIAYNDDSDVWGTTYSSTVYFVAPAPGDYYVQVIQNSDGDQGEYWLKLGDGIGYRIAGANRYATAASVSQLIYSQTQSFGGYGVNGPSTVVIASGESFADALAGAAFAMQNDGVLLLTAGGVLPADTKKELGRLLTSHAADVYILGGTGAVSAAVEQQIGMAGAGVDSVTRLAGANRFATASLVASEGADRMLYGTTAFIANGFAFADALAAGPVAAYASAPILLASATDIPAETIAYLEDNGVTQVYVCGGEGAIGPAAFAELQSVVGTAGVERVAGANRYETARELAQLGVDTFGLDGQAMVLASGENFPDGLAAGTLSWWTAGPLLLTPGSALSPSVTTFVEDNGIPDWPSYLVGGSGVIGSTAYREFQNLWMVDVQF